MHASAVPDVERGRLRAEGASASLAEARVNGCERRREPAEPGFSLRVLRFLRWSSRRRCL